MHLGLPSRQPPAKSWWEDPALRTGRFTKNELVASVWEHGADQDERAGSNPPAWGALYRPTRPQHQQQPVAYGRQNFQDEVMTHKGDGRETWVPDSGTRVLRQAVVSSVVNVPKEAKLLADYPKYKATMEEIFKVYGDVLSSKPCQNPPVRGAIGEATIPLKQGYRPQCHRDFQMKGQREQAMVKILKDFIERGWIELCSSEWDSPCFVVPKKVAEEWRLVADYRDLNSESGLGTGGRPLYLTRQSTPLPQTHPTSRLPARRHRQPSTHPRAPGETDGPPLPLGTTPSKRPSPPPETTHPAPQGATTTPHQGRPMARPQAHPCPGRTYPLPVRPHHLGGLGTLQDMPPPYGQGHTSGLVPGRNPTATPRLANPQPRTPGHRTPLQGSPGQGSHHERGGDTGPTPTPRQTHGGTDGGSSAPPARSSPQSSGPNGTPQTPPVDTHGTAQRPHRQGTHAASHPLPCGA